MTEKMLVVCGRHRETLVEREVTYVGAGAGEIDCLACGGTGVAPHVRHRADTEAVPCDACKGTGRTLVSV